jgi:putative ABC transport system permease protein
MVGHYLLTLWRTLTRHRLYAALNVSGLAVGVAVFLVLALYVRFESSFERWIPGARSIYLVRETWTLPGSPIQNYTATMGGLLDELKGDYPQLVGARDWNNTGTVRHDAEISSEQVEVVDPSFFKVFDLPLARGDKARLLRTPDEVLLSETRARRYFGSLDPIGRRLTISLRGQTRDYRVTGILKDPPKNSDFTFDILVPLTPQMATEDGRPWTNWGSSQLSTYLRFPAPSGAAALDADFDRFTDRHGTSLGKDPHGNLRLRTVPLLSLHLGDSKDLGAVATLGVVGLLTLILASVNYVNLATARAGLRAREVAIRKVMGATVPTLIGQFMVEAIATTTVAGLIGLALCELALPTINAAGGLSLKIAYFGGDSVAPLLVGVVVLVGLGAGVYPALVLSHFQPAGVLASAHAPGGGRAGARVREILVIVQFAFAIAFIVGAAVIVSQARYLRHADLGFRREGLIVVSGFGDADVTAGQRSTLIGLWRATPGVAAATTSDIAPGDDGNSNASNFTTPGMKGNGPTLNWVRTGPDFARTYGVRLVAGRLLDQEHGLDDVAPATTAPNLPSASRLHDIMVNARAVQVLGFTDPQAALGQIIRQGAAASADAPTYRIVGVIDNFRFRSPRAPIPATIYYFQTADFTSTANRALAPSDAIAGVRFAGADPRAVMERLRMAWRQVAPSVPFTGKTIEDNLQLYYASDDERGRLFTIGAVLAVGIGCLGLYGMASFNTARRVKEIGVRKTLGASTGEILALLIGQFLRPVLIANLIAWPLAYFAMRNWLSGFDQRIDLSPLYFLAATVLALMIAVVAVAGHAFAVARAEPAKALRHE